MSDSSIAWNPRMDEPSNPYPSSNASSIEFVRRNRKVLHQTGEIAEPEVDYFDPFFRREFDHFCGTSLLHLSSSSTLV